MAYTNNIPQQSQTINETTNLIQSNFALIQQLINVNHVDFDDSANMGKHNYVSLPSQGSAPSTSSTEVAVFSQLSSVTNAIELFFRAANSGVISQLSDFASLTASGWCIITNGILMKWGSGTINNSTPLGISFSSGPLIPVFSSSPYYISFSPYGNSNIQYKLSNILATGFTVQITYAIPVPFSYLVLGPTNGI